MSIFHVIVKNSESSFRTYLLFSDCCCVTFSFFGWNAEQNICGERARCASGTRDTSADVNIYMRTALQLWWWWSLFVSSSCGCAQSDGRPLSHARLMSDDETAQIFPTQAKIIHIAMDYKCYIYMHRISVDGSIVVGIGIVINSVSTVIVLRFHPFLPSLIALFVTCYYATADVRATRAVQFRYFSRYAGAHPFCGFPPAVLPFAFVCCDFL